MVKSLPGLLAIFVTLSTIVRAQQPQSQPSTVDQKRTAPKLVDEKPPTNSLTEPDAKLPVYQVHRIAEKILALNSVRAKAFEMARLAAVLWKQDEPYSRSLFEKALNLTTANGTDAETKALSTLHRRIIALVARTDAKWAKRLIDSATKREAEDQSSKSFSSTNIRTALGLVEEDPTVAAQFAERSLKGGINPAFLDFVLTLRRKDEPEANRLFLQALNYLSQQPAVNIREFHSLGLYLFTSPELIDSDHYAITLVDQILVPNLSADRPGVPIAIARAYLATAADVLWRMTSDSEQRKYSYALCYLLLPKSRNIAPDLTAKLDAVMAALTPQVPTGMTSDTAFRYMNPPPTTTEEKLTNAENKPDQESRDIAYLEIAFQAWRKGDFKTARIAQGRISELEASQRLATIINFGDGAWAIKHNPADIAKAEALANRLPQGIERSILLQAIAKTRGRSADRYSTEETIDTALKAVRSISDGRRPFLLLTAAAQLANLKSAAVHTVMAETIKDFNSFDESALARLDWAQTVQIGPLNARFPLDVANLDFNFTEAFHTVALVDPEAAMARAEELRHENLRAQALVEVGRAFLDKIPLKPIQNAAQDLSPSILQAIPGVAEKLHSPNIDDRISVLDELVKNKQSTHLIGFVLPYNLPASDYSVVVKSILDGNWEQLEQNRVGSTWSKITYVVTILKLKDLAKPLTQSLPKSAPPIQLVIIQTLRALNAVESAPQLVTLLQSPQEYVRREALRTLVSLRAKEAVPPLVALLQDKDEQQRGYALTSLVELNAKETASEVVKILEDPRENLRYWALDTLVKFNAREYANAVWKLTEASQQPHTQKYALAALIYFGETRAIPLAIERATEGGEQNRRFEMFDFLVTVKATAIVPALIAVLESRTVLGGNPPDIGTDMNIRREIMKCLGQLKAREAIPVLRAYARGRDPYTSLQQGAVETLGILGAPEGVNDLLVLLNQPVTDEAATAEVGLALAKIGDRSTWRKLIDLAARPACPYRGEIISELNRHLDRELWERVQTQRVSGLYLTSAKTTVEAFNRQSGIRIILDYQPGKVSSPDVALAGDGYPWANTSVEEISLSYGLNSIVEGLSNNRIPHTYTFIFDDKQIRILSVDSAIEWWRKNILTKI